MYRSTISHALVCLAAAGLWVTADAAGPIQVGGTVGLNMAKDRLENDDSDAKFKPGFHVEGSVEVGMNEQVSIATGLGFSQKGGKFEYSSEGFDGEYTSKINYLTIPVTAKVSFGTSDVRPFVKIGPEIGFLLSAKEDVKVTTGGNTTEEEIDFKDETKSLDLSALFGGGADFPLGETMTGVAEAGYILGLLDISDAEPEVGVEESSLKTSVFYIRFGVRMPFGAGGD